MKILVVALVLIRWATAQQTVTPVVHVPPVTGVPSDISVPAGTVVHPLTEDLKAAQQEARVSRIETLDLKEQLLTKQFEAIHAEKMALYAEACKAAGLATDPKVCFLDFATHTVNKQQTVPEKK